MKLGLSRKLVKSYLESSRFRACVRVLCVVVVVLLVEVLVVGRPSFLDCQNVQDGPNSVVIGQDEKKSVYSAYTHPIIFIGGHPRSGTTLMRSMLDAHSWVRCGEETRILPNILQMRLLFNDGAEKPRLLQGGITDQIIASAFAAFFLETIAQHGEPPKVLCNKDPLLLNHAEYISNDMFPRSRWIFMLRDGRAVVHSIVSRKITISGYNNDDPEQALRHWNNAVESMNIQCENVGVNRCMKVRYEDLVLHPRSTMEKVLEFLELPWEEDVLHHEDFINKDGKHGIRVSVRERSSDQVIKPINLNALSQWVGSFSADVLDRMPAIAPMLSRLGYDPTKSPPKYGDPDPEVLEKTRYLARHSSDWLEKSEQLMKDMEKDV